MKFYHRFQVLFLSNLQGCVLCAPATLNFIFGWLETCTLQIGGV